MDKLNTLGMTGSLMWLVSLGRKGLECHAQTCVSLLWAMSSRFHYLTTTFIALYLSTPYIIIYLFLI